MSSQLLLGIDVGTSSVKLTALRPSGDVTASVAVEYRAAFPRPGWVEQDPEDWYRALREALAILVRRDAFDLSAVGAIGVTGQMRGVVLLDGVCAAIRPAILWNDLRNADELAGIQPELRQRVELVTRNALNTMCTLPKLLWVMRHERQIWEAARVLVFPKDYIRGRLTGSFVTDPSDASGTSFFDVRRGEWSAEVLDAFDIDRSRLPGVRPSTEVVGWVTRRAASETALREGVPVVCGGSDATVESFAAGLTDSTQCKVRLGTSGALSTVVDDIDRTSAGYCWSYVTTGTWMLDTNTRSCGQAITWLRDLCYGGRRAGAAGFAEIDREARDVALGADGVVFHPYLLGEDAPYWDPALRASFTGLSIGHGRAHLARAVYEGTAFALKDAMTTFESLVPGFRRFLFVGGGVRAPAWLAIVSDILGVDGDVPVAVDASTGAAMLAGIGIGVFRDAADAVRVCGRVERQVSHDPAATERYAPLFERYRHLKQALGVGREG